MKRRSDDVAGVGGGGGAVAGWESFLPPFYNQRKVKLSLDDGDAHQLMDEASSVGVAFRPGSGSLRLDEALSDLPDFLFFFSPTPGPLISRGSAHYCSVVGPLS